MSQHLDIWSKYLLHELGKRIYFLEALKRVRTYINLKQRKINMPHDCTDAGGRTMPGHLHGCKWSKMSGTNFPAIVESSQSKTIDQID